MSSFNDFFNKNRSAVATASTSDMKDELERREGHLNIFPLEIFHEKVRPYITELHTKMDVPRSFIGLSMLLTYSSAIGTAFAVSRNKNDRMALSVWACLNGMTSSGKSIALGQILKPLNDIQEEYDKEWEDETQGLNDRELQFKDMKTLIFRDSHIPTLVRGVMPKNPKGVLKYADELLEWLNGMNSLSKKEGTDEQFWLTGWNSLKYSAIRSGNQKFTIPRPFVNLVGGIQPQLAYRLYKNDRDVSGFIFRMLFANLEEERIASPEHGYDIPDEFANVHFNHVKKLHNRLPVDSAYDKQKVCVLSKDASRTYIEWYSQRRNTANAIKDAGERNIHAGILGKISEYTYRFAAILAISDRAFEMTETDLFFPNELTISADQMKRAIMAADYFYRSAVDVYEIVDSTVTATPEILNLAMLWKMNKPYSQIADQLQIKGWQSMKDAAKRQAISRLIKQAIKDYPKIFGAVNK